VNPHEFSDRYKNLLLEKSDYVMDNPGSAFFLDLPTAILYTAAYADVFDYPLSSAEIQHYLTGVRASRDEVEQVLRGESLLSRTGIWYTLPGREHLAAVRQRREQIAARLWPQALGYGRLIAGLPFVRMVAVTGSLAMNNVENNPDIDYLVVTAGGRLWMVRAMVLAAARLAALKGVCLCPNYLVSEQALVFENHTLYTAHELAQMIPLFGMDVYQRISGLNRWKERLLPNAEGLPPTMDKILLRNKPVGMKPALEAALSLPPGTWFERWEMRRKMRMLSQEQSSSPESRFGADYCKGHKNRHAEHTEQVLRQRLANLHLEMPV
jgi:hypothetical protein